MVSSVHMCFWCLCQAFLRDVVLRAHKIDLKQVEKYEQAFMKAAQWGFFTENDARVENRIEGATSDPEFVKNFSNVLSRKRGVDGNVRCFAIF